MATPDPKGQVAAKSATAPKGTGMPPPPAVKVSGHARGNGAIKVNEHQRKRPAAGRGTGPKQDEVQEEDAEEQEGVGGDAETQPTEPDVVAQPPPPKRAMTVDEYLQHALREQAELLERQMTGAGDPAKEAAVARDVALNTPPEPPGKSHFIADLKREAKAAGLEGDHTVNSIIINALSHHYDDHDGDWGKASLVPHLQEVGLFQTANRVMEMQYKF